MELNSFMSLSEAGVVVGVLLEGTEYIPPIHRRWPVLEKLGFFILVLALVADWHFQSAINERQTDELISANNRIIALAPRYWMLVEGPEDIVPKLAPFASQKVVILQCQDSRYDPNEISAAADSLAFRLDTADWLNAWGERILLPYPASAGKGRMYNKIVFDNPDRGRCSQGVFVEAKLTAPQRVRDAAKTLANALNRAHVATADVGRLNWPVPSFLPPSDDLIIVSIGMKGR